MMMDERIFIGKTPLQKTTKARPASANIRIRAPFEAQNLNRFSAQRNEDVLRSLKPFVEHGADSFEKKFKKSSSPSHLPPGARISTPKQQKATKISSELFGVARENSNELQSVIRTLDANYKREMKNKIRLDSMLTQIEEQVLEDLIKFSEAYEPSLGARLSLDLNKIIKGIEGKQSSPFGFPKKEYVSPKNETRTPSKDPILKVHQENPKEANAAPRKS